MDSNNQAGSQPLTEPNIESCVLAVSAGQSQRSAYQEFISKDCSRTSAKQSASRLFRRPDVRARLTFINLASKRLTTRLSREDLRNVLQVIVNTAKDNDKLNAIKQLTDFEDQDKRVQDALSNLDPATIAARLGQYEGAPATAEHLRAVIERLVALLNVSLAEVVQACADRDSAPPSEPSVAKPITINTLQQVDSSNPAKS